MREQTALVVDVVLPTLDEDETVNIKGNVCDYRWFLVGSETYADLTYIGFAGITAYDCAWVGFTHEQLG